MDKKANDKILKAISEARKLLEDTTGIGSGSGTVDIGTGLQGKDAEGVATLNTAQKETQIQKEDEDHNGEEETEKDKKEEKPDSTKAVVPLKSGEEPPQGFLQIKKGLRVAVNPEAIQDPASFIAKKHKEEA